MSIPSRPPDLFTFIAGGGGTVEMSAYPGFDAQWMLAQCWGGSPLGPMPIRLVEIGLLTGIPIENTFGPGYVRFPRGIGLQQLFNPSADDGCVALWRNKDVSLFKIDRPPDIAQMLAIGETVQLTSTALSDGGWWICQAWTDMGLATVTLGAIPFPNFHPGWVRFPGGASNLLSNGSPGSVYVTMWRVKS